MGSEILRPLTNATSQKPLNTEQRMYSNVINKNRERRKYTHTHTHIYVCLCVGIAAIARRFSPLLILTFVSVCRAAPSFRLSILAPALTLNRAIISASFQFIDRKT